MLWIAINQGPVGFDMDTFQGPALNMMYTFSYICPVVFARFYFSAKESKSRKKRLAVSIFILFLTLCILGGTGVATMGMWLPSL